MSISLRERFFWLEPPQRKRTKPLEVLALGPSRTATQSLKKALDMLGYENTYHAFLAIARTPDWVVWSELAVRKFESHDRHKYITAADFDRVIGDCTAVTDTPCMPFSRELLAAYPNAKVILNSRRDMDAWYQSWLDNIQISWHESWWRWAAAWFDSEAFWLWRGFDLVNMHFYRHNFRASGKFVYAEHLAMVRGLVPRERLLEWTAEDGWEPLCEFLGKPVPQQPFPKTNNGSEFAAQTFIMLGRCDAAARRNMVLTACMFMAVFASVLYQSFKGRV